MSKMDSPTPKYLSAIPLKVSSGMALVWTLNTSLSVWDLLCETGNEDALETTRSLDTCEYS